jgi:hypothetical protein
MTFATIVAVLFALVVGAAFCMYGYRIFLVLLPVWGFFAGFWLGAHVMQLLFGSGFLATTSGWMVGIAVGLVLSVLSYLFYLLGVAMVAAVVGYGIGAGLMGALGISAPLLVVLVGVIVAIVVMAATLLFNLQQYVVTALTALGGANAVLLGVLLLLGRVSLDSVVTAGSAIRPVLQDSWFWALAWIVIAVAGIVYQIRTNRAYAFSQDRYMEGWG